MEIIFEQDPRFQLHESERKETDWQYGQIMKAVSSYDYMNQTWDWTNDIPHIFNQKDTGFCWAFSAALMQSAYDTREEDGENIILSPFYVAKMGKTALNDGFPDTEGSTTKNSVDAITKFGSIKEQLYDGSEYVTGSLDFPEIKDEDRMRHYKSRNYARCNSIEDIVYALSQRKLPLIGLNCTREFYDLQNGASKYLEFDAKGSLFIIGGHQMVVCGWFPDMEHNGHKGYIKCANSWGREYGDNGFMYIPKDYVEFRTSDGFFRMLSDCMAVVDLNNDNIKQKCVEMTIDSKVMLVNDKEIIMDISPFIHSDRTFIPIRYVGEALNAKVSWSEKDRKVTVQKNGTEIILYIGQNYAFVNGQRVDIDAPPFIEANRCLCPLRFIAEHLDFVVLWHGKSGHITILQ